MAGVPASETSATLSPSRRRRRIPAPARALLYSWKTTIGVRISYRFSSFTVRRVSSQAITGASFRTRTARKVMSSRFPSGVATTYSVPELTSASYSFLWSMTRIAFPSTG